MRVILSGGGTGGHIYPALAVGKELQKQVPDIEILFVGARGKMEMEKVPEEGFDIKGLWISGWHRGKWLRNLSFPVKLLSSLWKARSIIRQFRPDVAAGFGGYASGPLLEMAVRSGIATLIQEQNSYPGVTNRLLGKRVDKICVAYEEMERFFPAGKITLTGNPVRAELYDLSGKRERGYDHFGLDPDKKTLLITGGSLGAKSLNEMMRLSQERLMAADDIQVLWQCGSLYEDRYRKTVTAELDHVHIMAFLRRMDLAYACADLVVCRAGALSLSELALAGKAAVLIPSPNVAEDHQTKNAQALVRQDAAWMVADAMPPSEKMAQVMAHLRDESGRKARAKRIKQLAKPEAARDIARMIRSLVNGEKA